MNLLDTMDGIAYVVRHDGRILAYGRPHWDRFAAENDGKALCNPEAVLGQNLFDAIAGPEVRARYRGWMDAVLRNRQGEPAILAARCDSPTAKRELRLSISRVTDAPAPAVLFQSVVTAVESRPPLNIYDFEALSRALRARPDLPVVTLCSFCQRLRWPPGERDPGRTEWIEAELYYARGGRSEVAVSHGLCEDCVNIQDMAA
jgi:hypothetical protein